MRRLGPLPVFALALAFASGCRPDEPGGKRYYDQHIQPIFNSFCVGGTSPCHKADDNGVALGNLDLTSFENVKRRPDALRFYGSYPQPLLLLKAIPEADVLLPYRGTLLTSEIRHAGGKTLSLNSDAYYELRRWLDNGATIDGVAPPAEPAKGRGACSEAVPPDIERLPVDTSAATYRDYLDKVDPILKSSCAYGTCHGAPQSDFYLTCGTDDAQKQFNYLQVAGFVAPAGTNVEQSELLLRPLAPLAGGISHSGGIFYSSRTDAAWTTLRDWALAVQAAPPPAAAKSKGQDFFEANVMPVLLRRGCALEGCHSPSGFNDFRLGPGAQGFFAPHALRRNYLATIGEFMALDVPDVRQSRAVKKALFASSGGITHRGGPVLESPGGDSKMACPSPYDAATASAFCTFAEWLRVERGDRAALVSPMNKDDVLPLAFVARPPDGDDALAFDTPRGGADLMLADAHLGDLGHVVSVDNVRSALGPCVGLAGAGDLDVRGPEWSYDGTKVVFAARTGNSGLDLWLLDVAGNSCRRLTNDNGRAENGVRVNNFDPVFTPESGLVFASSRRGLVTPKLFLPNADLYRVGADLDFGKVEEMTWLSGSELQPAFMQDGRLTMTTEKAHPDFYQLSGRRINWDLTDYHPLLAQRAASGDTFGGPDHASVGYSQATEIREGLDRNFLVIFSDVGAKGGAGALATFNRSVGPFEEGRAEVTFVRSVAIIDPAATGRAGTKGAYRSPYALPDGEILASYAANVSNPAADVPRFDLVAVAPGGTRRTLVPGNDKSLVEAALGYKRSAREVFKNLPQLVFGGHGGFVEGGDDAATVHFPDLPMLATLLGANLRRGRNVEAMDKASALRVWEVHPPAGAAPDMSRVAGAQNVYKDWTSLGTASFEADRSLKVGAPSRKPLILELVDAGGGTVAAMTEEHQFGPGEYISPGVPRALFNGICAGCHGSISGRELDVAINPDALTGASVSLSRDQAAKTLR